MARKRSSTAQEAAATDEPTVDASPVEVEQVTLQDVVDEALSLARGMRATNVYMPVRQTPGGRLPKPLDDYPNGLGGQTFYGVYLQTDWKTKNPPFFESLSSADARAVWFAMEELKEVSWRHTRQRTDGPNSEVQTSGDPDDLLMSDQEVEPMLRMKQRTRRPRGLGGDGLPQRKSSRGRRSRG